MMNLCNAKVNIKHGVVALLLDAKLHCDEKGLKYDFNLIPWIFIFIFIFILFIFIFIFIFIYIYLIFGQVCKVAKTGNHQQEDSFSQIWL